MRILCIDIGTTAVKAAIVEAPPLSASPSGGMVPLALVASASVATGAYREEAGCSSRAEQDIGKIWGALEQSLRRLHSDTLASCEHVAIADQMHGVVRWQRADLAVASPLVTWEDRRCDAAILAAVNRRLALLPHACSAVHSGYGIATLVHWFLYEPGAAAIFDACGTIGSFLAASVSDAAASPSLGQPFMDGTDAASWGALPVMAPSDGRARSWEIAAVEAVIVSAAGNTAADPVKAAAAAAAALRGMLPRVVDAGTVVGALHPASCARANLPTLAALAAGASLPVFVHVAIGDHPASVLGALHDAGSCLGLGPSGLLPLPGRPLPPTLLLNVGTSAQAACLVRGAAGTSGPLPPGCELRPFPELLLPLPALGLGAVGSASADPDAGTSSSSSMLLVAASMNGGNVLRRLASAAAAGLGGNLDAAYASLEAAALPLLQQQQQQRGAAAGVEWPAAGAASSFPAVGGVRVDPSWFVPERGSVEAGEAEGGGSLEAAAVPLPAAVTAATYAAAALSLLHNLLVRMLPAGLLALQCAPAASASSPLTVVLSGGAFRRSAVLRQALRLLLEHLLLPGGDGQGGERLGREQGSRCRWLRADSPDAAEAEVAGPSSTARVVVLELPAAATESCGAIGAALAALYGSGAAR